MVPEIVSPLNLEAYRNESPVSSTLIGSKHETRKNCTKPFCLLASSYEILQSSAFLCSSLANCWSGVDTLSIILSLVFHWNTASMITSQGPASMFSVASTFSFHSGASIWTSVLHHHCRRFLEIQLFRKCDRKSHQWITISFSSSENSGCEL